MYKAFVWKNSFKCWYNFDHESIDWRIMCVIYFKKSIHNHPTVHSNRRPSRLRGLTEYPLLSNWMHTHWMRSTKGIIWYYLHELHWVIFDWRVRCDNDTQCGSCIYLPLAQSIATPIPYPKKQNIPIYNGRWAACCLVI